MKYYIGVDGGGTKTDCVITDEGLNVLHQCTGEASNYSILGVDTVCENILSLVEECRSASKIEYIQISAAVFGIAGAGRIADAEKLQKAFIQHCAAQLIEFPVVHVESDARIALEGAFSGRPGSILIAGTGSIMFGTDASGNIIRNGGYGRYIGDEGSGYSIGRKGLNALAKCFDGRGGKTMLKEIIAEEKGIETPEDLINEVYKNNFDIASAASPVLKAAELGDPACLKIVEEETDELILHISTMAEKINESVLEISFAGGLISTDNFYSSLLLKKIKNRLSNIIIKKPEHPPVIGAVLMAKKLA